MRRVAAFLTRLGVFVLLAYIQSLMVSLDAVILQLDARLLLSSCQIAIFGGMLTVYLLCRWIFEIMHTSRMYNNVNMDSVNQAHNDLASLGGIPEEEAFQDSSFHASTCTNVHLETASQISKGLIANQVVIFANREALSSHVMQIYFIGFLLWATVYCFNYTIGYIFFHASTGFVLGYMIRVFLTQETLLISFYCAIMSMLTCVTYIHFFIELQSESNWMGMNAKDVLVGVLSPIFIGILWASGLLFGTNNRFCLSMAKEAFPVCLLCVMPIMWATPIDSFQHIFMFFEIDMYLMSLLVEPSIKFLAIYTMMLSLQTNNTIDIVIAVIFVAHGQVFTDFDWNRKTTPLLIIQLILLLLLVLLRFFQYCYTDIFYLMQRSRLQGSSFNSYEMDLEAMPSTPPSSFAGNQEASNAPETHP
tara:strand:+ start:1210 stop:2463 length:1254 start_codon:yes stop_codon:yes gene_type:complete